MPASDSDPPSDHLLRTLAAVPVSSTILDLGCGRGRHTEPLLRLGFPVHACDPRPDAVDATRARVQDLVGDTPVETAVQMTPLDAIDYPDETFDWVVADRAETYASTEDELRTLLAEARRLLTPGGWLYLTLPAAAESEGAHAGLYTAERLEALRTEVEFAEASAPSRIDGTNRLRALYRRVDPQTPA
jgi:SAM-dependent methyltransferase